MTIHTGGKPDLILRNTMESPQDLLQQEHPYSSPQILNEFIDCNETIKDEIVEEVFYHGSH